MALQSTLTSDIPWHTCPLVAETQWSKFLLAVCLSPPLVWFFEQGSFWPWNLANGWEELRPFQRLYGPVATDLEGECLAWQGFFWSESWSLDWALQFGFHFLTPWPTPACPPAPVEACKSSHWWQLLSHHLDKTSLRQVQAWKPFCRVII